MAILNEHIEAAVDALTAAIEAGDIIPATVCGPFTLHFEAGDLPSSEFDRPSDIGDSTDGQGPSEPLVGTSFISILDAEGSVDRNLHMSAVDRESLQETLLMHIGSIAAAAYMFGRSDQLADALGNDSTRFVRAQELPAILRQAQESAAGSVVIDSVNNWVQDFGSVRATIDPRDITSQPS